MFNATDPSPEYELDWPRELFAAEATALLADLSNPRWLEDAELLLEEAFTLSVPKEDLRTAQGHDLPTGLFKNAPAAGAAEVARAFVAHVVNSADKLPEGSKRRQYWSARRVADTASTQPTAPNRTEELQQDWVRLVEDLRDRGYLDCVAPQGCVVKPASTPAAEVLAAKLTRSLHVDIRWPLPSQDLDSDTFYSLIEAVHDLIARPRHRDRHSIEGCRWHYSNFAPTPAQVLYRWDVNQLLDRYSAGLRIAAEGEDMGRLVRVAGDDRNELVERTLQTPNPGDRDAVRHAVALFRNRAADRENKRSARIGTTPCAGGPARSDQGRVDEQGRGRPVPDRQRVRPSPQRGTPEDGLRRRLPGLDLLVVPGHRGADRQHRRQSGRQFVSRLPAVPATADGDQGQDPVALLDAVPLTPDETEYVEAARAANTLRGYRSDWREFASWCTQHEVEPMAAAPATVTGYLSDLARHGAKVGTMSRRLSAIKFAHQMRNLSDPTRNARVVAVWEGIRRTHGAPPDQAAPLMPPELFDVLDACPATKVWRTPGRPDEPDLAGARDRALLLVGFVAALRRSELAVLTIDQVAEHPNGLVLTLPRSKTNQTGKRVELVVLPRAGNPARCP